MEWFVPENRRNDIGLLIFDLDGTLADTVGGIRNAINLAMQQHGFPICSTEKIRLAMGNGAYRLIERCLPPDAAEKSELVQQMLEAYHAFYDETFGDSRLYDGVSDSLKVLRERGYQLAVLSNKPDRYVQKIVEMLFPCDLFSYVSGQTDRPKKPDATVPLMIAKQLDISPEQTAFIGDTEVDVQTAVNAGMLAVGCSWGYRGRDVLLQAGVHVVAESPREWLELFA